jgi:hypothetical protein
MEILVQSHRPNDAVTIDLILAENGQHYLQISYNRHLYGERVYSLADRAIQHFEVMRNIYENLSITGIDYDEMFYHLGQLLPKI